MIYPADIEKKIDFLFLRDYLVRCCLSPFGQERVKLMHWQTDYSTICTCLRQTEEFLRLLQNASVSFPQTDIFDLREPLKRIELAGLYLNEDECLAVRTNLQYVHETVAILKKLDPNAFPQMHRLVGAYAFECVEIILKDIDAVLDKYGKIKDSASPELSRLRREKVQAQSKVNGILQSILKSAVAEGMMERDAAPTVRDGRMVLPVSPMYKKKLKGIIHDESASGKTIFIEPQQVVEANNAIRELENAQRREEIRLLMVLSDNIRPHLPAIDAMNSFIGEVDFLRAKALLAVALFATMPNVEQEPVIEWKNVRHPVLFLTFQQLGKTVVPLSLRLGLQRQGNEHDKARILVISGPNAGGKSVCLKTVALVQYMLQCGLLVPLHGSSTMGIFQDMFIDIGDEQSIQDDLSTYSSHLQNMKFFIKNANRYSFVLIDEFGSGTEPMIGGAMAEAILRKIASKQAFGVITTHYTNLKHLAQKNEMMTNGAMLYDKSAMKPLFQLSVGQAGSSYAIEIARQIGLPKEVVEEAIQLVGEEHIDYDKQLNDIARDKHYWETKRQRIKEREKVLEEKITQYETEVEILQKKQKEILKEAHEQAANILQDANATIEKTIKDIRETNANKQATKQARKSVDKLKEKVTEMVPQAPATKQKKVFRSLQDLQSLTNKTNVVNPSKNVSKTASTIRSKSLDFHDRLDIRGQYAEDAQNIIMDYIDDAIMMGVGSVSILHGTGTGALKQVVRDYLKTKDKLMRNRGQGRLIVSDGDVDRGGAGITIVTFEYKK